MQLQVLDSSSSSICQILQIGFAKFKQSFQRNQLYDLISTSLKNILSKQNWRIRSLSDQWIQTFKQMLQNHCKRIFFESVSYEMILSDISLCRFPNLTVLNLSHNPICSLQPLMYIDASCLQFIYLSTNNITSVKSLGKIQFKNLQQFDLSCNKIKQIPQICRYKTNKENTNFSIQLFSFSKSHHHHQNHNSNQSDDSSHSHEHEPICRIQNLNQMAKLQLCNQNHHKIMNKTTLKYEMLKRQFQKFIIQLTTGVKLTEYVPQKTVMKKLQNKFRW